MTQILYPAIEPFQKDYLQTAGEHRIYYECCGNRQGYPILFLHGGPGAGCAPVHRRFFDPGHYMAVLFDQRGCGRSTPKGSLQENTTWHLIEDIEAIRKQLGIKRWHVFGGSWGSTLALAYAEQHPDMVSGLILRGIWTATKEEMDWFFKTGIPKTHPESFAILQNYLGPERQENPLQALYEDITGTDISAQKEAAKTITAYEMSAISIKGPDKDPSLGGSDFSLTYGRILLHYMQHGCWLEDGQLMKNINYLKDIPTHILHGRHDAICPPETAYKLAKVMPHAKFSIIETAGHSAFDPGLQEALVKAANDLRNITD